MTNSLMICASMYTNAFFSLQNEVEDCVRFAGVDNDAIIIVQVGRKKRIITDREKKMVNAIESSQNAFLGFVWKSTDRLTIASKPKEKKKKGNWEELRSNIPKLPRIQIHIMNGLQLISSPILTCCCMGSPHAVAFLECKCFLAYLMIHAPDSGRNVMMYSWPPPPLWALFFLHPNAAVKVLLNFLKSIQLHVGFQHLLWQSQCQCHCRTLIQLQSLLSIACQDGFSTLLNPYYMMPPDLENSMVTCRMVYLVNGLPSLTCISSNQTCFSLQHIEVNPCL